MKLRTWAPYVIVSLFVLFLGASASLLFLTTSMSRSARQVRLGLVSVRTAQSIKVHVLEISRLRTLWALTQSQTYLNRAAAEQDRIEAEFQRAKRVEISPEGQKWVSDAENSFREYLRTRESFGRKGALSRALVESSGPLQSALAGLDVLIQNDVERADRALAESQRTDQISNQIAGVTLGVSALFLVFLVRAMLRFLVRPLEQLYAVILRYSGGQRNARVALRGVEEIQLVAGEFNALADQIADFDRKRVQFLTGTAHDLRNPLTVLKTSIDLFEHRYATIDEKQRTESMNLIRRQVARLESLTSSFMDSVRVDAGDFSLELRQVDAVSVITDVVRLWESASDRHHFALKFPPGPILTRCDPMRLEQIATNLISNAIKYSPLGGEIEVSLELNATAQQIEFSVRDHGIGISSDTIEKIFEPFHRAPQAQGLIPGVGIGLWVTHRLVEAHGGSISVESTPGAGSTFRVVLPISGEGRSSRRVA